jgi:3-hydroxyisobutyrate dehydrogenase-like beta-hydroxyacid dehydrogenase
MRLGFIGLGKMGTGIVESLLRAGHEVTVWNRSPEPVEALAAKGAAKARSPEETLHGDALLSMLASDAAIRDVGLGGKLLDKAPRGLIHANLATISIDFARQLTEAHRQRGLGYVAATVFGRPEVAAAGELNVVAAGPKDALERLQTAFAAFGKRTTIVGNEPYQANLFKIAGNFMIAAALETMGEAFALLRKGGLDPRQFHEVLTSSLFAAPVYQNYGAAILDGKFEPAGFALKLGMKDVGLARAAAGELAVPMPLADLVHNHFEEAANAGMADKDWSALAALIARHAGLQHIAGGPS